MGWNKLPVGGWMYSSLQNLRQVPDFNMAIATIYSGKEFIVKDIDHVRYYLLPLSGRSKFNYNPNLEEYWQKLANEFKPDIVHIHGSEFPHGLAYVNAVGSNGVVVSIQGMISGIARYYDGGIDYRNIKKCLTFRDFIRHNGLRYGRAEFEHRGNLERELISKVCHVIGRTAWDKAHTWAINSKAKYYYCGESLRESFYRHVWKYENCVPHTIFVSQAGYALKGFHKLLEAFPLILRHYSDAKVIVAGSDPTKAPWWRLTGYGKYLKTLIKRHDLYDHIEFVGMLHEEQMCQAYLKANVFVCSSSIENSPNSLGEAQLLGMPHVASYVGGIPEIVNGNPDVIYRFDEIEMLAKKVCQLFAIGKDYKAPEYDRNRYNWEKNRSDLVAIYNNIKTSEKQ